MYSQLVLANYETHLGGLKNGWFGEECLIERIKQSLRAIRITIQNDLRATRVIRASNNRWKYLDCVDQHCGDFISSLDLWFHNSIFKFCSEFGIISDKKLNITKNF